MSRTVLLIDSNTGALVDVAGNSRESGRYAKFARRMLSFATNPVLNYGYNGGDILEISKNGQKGREIRLVADTVSVSGSLKIAGSTLNEVILSQIGDVLDKIVGTDGEILVETVPDPRPGAAEGSTLTQISLDPMILTRIEALENAIGGSGGAFVTRDDVAGLAEGISIDDADTLDDVKLKLGLLLERIAAMNGASSSSESSSSSSSSSSSGSSSSESSSPEEQEENQEEEET